MASSSDLTALYASVTSDGGAGKWRSDHWDRMRSGAPEVRGQGMVRSAERHFADFLGTIAAQPDLSGAPCTQVDPEVFFPKLGESAQKARAICRDCPVRAECLEWSLGGYHPYGVLGGHTAKERALLKRERGVA